jgi:hypothetical protein
MDQVKMGTLYAILTNTENDPGFMLDDDAYSYTVSDDGPWVQLVPDDMVQYLSSLSDSDVPSIAAKWGQTEEFESEYSGWTLDDITRFIRQMISLSQKALAEGKAIFMWVSL